MDDLILITLEIIKIIKTTKTSDSVLTQAWVLGAIKKGMSCTTLTVPSAFIKPKC